MSNFFKESDCDSTGYYSANEFERISGIRTAGPTISLDKANALIKERGTVVYGPLKSHQGDMYPMKTGGFFQQEKEFASHRALLINIEPLEKDSAEKIVEELVNAGKYEPPCDSYGVCSNAREEIALSKMSLDNEKSAYDVLAKELAEVNDSIEKYAEFEIARDNELAAAKARVAELERIHEGCSSLAIRIDAASASYQKQVDINQKLVNDLAEAKAEIEQHTRANANIINQANARIKELEADVKRWTENYISMGEREQNLVAALEDCSAQFKHGYRENVDIAAEALKANKGGA